jgi:hypothetical protein
LSDGGQDRLASAEAAVGEPLLRETRGGIALLLLLAIANGGFLYLVPSRAETDYAWAIHPPVSAAFMGAGYLAGVVATALAVSARSFASVRPLIPAFCTLGILLFAATLIHADRFRWDYLPTWLWTAVYALLPLIACYLWMRQRVAGASGPRAAAGSLRALTLGLGAVLLAVAVVLFAAPERALEEWPWTITPLLSRVYGGWYALAGVALVYSALTVARSRDGTIVYATVTAWALLALALPLLYEPDMRTESAGFWAWAALFVASAIVCGWALARGLADRGGPRSGNAILDRAGD